VAAPVVVLLGDAAAAPATAIALTAATTLTPVTSNPRRERCDAPNPARDTI
jgi:hypothetical protein